MASKFKLHMATPLNPKPTKLPQPSLESSLLPSLQGANAPRRALVPFAPRGNGFLGLFSAFFEKLNEYHTVYIYIYKLFDLCNVGA